MNLAGYGRNRLCLEGLGRWTIAIRVTEVWTGDLVQCAQQLSFGMLCGRKSVLGSDGGCCLATVKMNSPEGFGLCMCVLLRDRFFCFWCDSSLPIVWTQSHRICSAAWIAPLALRVEPIKRRNFVLPVQWRHLCELKRVMERFQCGPTYNTTSRGVLRHKSSGDFVTVGLFLNRVLPQRCSRNAATILFIAQ